jgi:hypothetical protein
MDLRYLRSRMISPQDRSQKSRGVIFRTGWSVVADEISLLAQPFAPRAKDDQRPFQLSGELKEGMISAVDRRAEILVTSSEVAFAASRPRLWLASGWECLRSATCRKGLWSPIS